MPRAWIFPARSRPRGCEATGDSAPGAGRALGGRSGIGLAAPRRLMPRSVPAGRAADVLLRLKTAPRPFRGEVFPCLGAVREAPGTARRGCASPGLEPDRLRPSPAPVGGAPVAPSASGGSASPAARLANCSRR